MSYSGSSFPLLADGVGAPSSSSYNYLEVGEGAVSVAVTFSNIHYYTTSSIVSSSVTLPSSSPSTSYARISFAFPF